MVLGRWSTPRHRMKSRSYHIHNTGNVSGYNVYNNIDLFWQEKRVGVEQLLTEQICCPMRQSFFRYGNY
jgi:hypothetical protein